MLCCNVLFGGVPKNIKAEISKASILKSDKDERREFQQDQERAYLRMLSLKEKIGMTDEEFDKEIDFLSKKYGKNYVVIYKYFAREMENKKIEAVKEKKEKIEKEKINLEAKKIYEEKIVETKIPKNISDYINRVSQEKYGNDYVERLKYQKNLEEFYFFIKK